jgi:hypothetical protein
MADDDADWDAMADFLSSLYEYSNEQAGGGIKGRVTGGVKKETAALGTSSSTSKVAKSAFSTAASGAAKVGNALGNFKPALMWLKDLIVAILILVIAIACVALLIYLFYYEHPRPIFFCWSSWFSTFMTQYSKDLIKNIDTLLEIKKNKPDVLTGSYGYAALVGKQDLFAGIDEITIDTVNLTDENVQTVLRFWDSLANKELGGMAKADLELLGEDFLDSKGEINLSKLQPLFKLREELGKLQKTIYTLREKLSSVEDGDGASQLGWIAGLADNTKRERVTSFLNNLKWDESKVSTEIISQIRKRQADNILPACHILFNEQSSTCRRPLKNEELFVCNMVRSKAYDAIQPKKTEVLQFIQQFFNKERAQTAAVTEEGKSTTQQETPAPATTGPVAHEAAKVLRTIMAVYELDLALNTYFEDVRAGYETRKVGFRWNYTMLKYYFAPYVKLIILIKIKRDIWEKFGKNFVKAITSFNDLWAKIPGFLGKLPGKLAGADGFKQHSDKEGFQGYVDYAKSFSSHLFEDFWAPLTHEQELVEHFGFLKGLVAIGQFFTGIMGLVTAIVALLTNPFAIIMLIIGLILAAVLMIVYILLTAIFAQVWFFGFLYALYTVWLGSILWTVFWIIMIIPLTVVYVILWILDMATGGFIMTLFRCESLPDSWFKNSTYAYGNRVFRGFLCNLRCAKRYKTTPGLMLDKCTRLPSQEPAFCPHQVIYQLYNGMTPDKHAIFRDFIVNPATALKTDDDRRNMLQSSYRLKQEHLETCDTCIRDDYRGIGNRKYYTYYHIIRAICRHGQHSPNIAGDPEKERLLCEACNIIFADDASPARKQKSAASLGLSASPPLPPDDKEKGGSSLIPNDIVIKSMTVFIVLIVLLALVAYYMHAAEKPEGLAVMDMLTKAGKEMPSVPQPIKKGLSDMMTKAKGLFKKK